MARDYSIVDEIVKDLDVRQAMKLVYDAGYKRGLNDGIERTEETMNSSSQSTVGEVKPKGQWLVEVDGPAGWYHIKSCKCSRCKQSALQKVSHSMDGSSLEFVLSAYCPSCGIEIAKEGSSIYGVMQTSTEM